LVSVFFKNPVQVALIHELYLFNECIVDVETSVSEPVILYLRLHVIPGGLKLPSTTSNTNSLRLKVGMKTRSLLKFTVLEVAQNVCLSVFCLKSAPTVRHASSF